jgi:type I restriction enzyme S subunit
MSDVSESGRWTFKQSRSLRSVTTGFTAFEEGDVLVAKITPCLENGKGAHAIGLENGIGFGSTEFHVLRARPGYEPRFVFHLTQWRRFRRAAGGQMVGSAGQQRVPRAFFDEFLVEDFGNGQQVLIADILDTLDTAIQETEAIIAKLKAVKQGLLHDLLTRGIDANGELRPTQAEAPHLYKESPLGWIPKEWGLKPLGQILAEPTKNGLYKPSQFHGRGPLMVQMGGLFAGDAATFATATRVQVTPFEFNTFGLTESDLLFARRSLVFEGAGQCVIVRNLPKPSTFESSIVRVRVRQDEANPEFVCQFLRGHRSYAQRRTLIRQVAVSGVSGADIRDLLIALPSPEEQGWLVRRQLEIQASIDLELETVAKLRSQKSALMDDLLTGRVRVTPLLEDAAP